MLKRIRRSWQLLRQSVPGRRFEDWYWHRCRSRGGRGGSHARALRVAGGIAMLVAGMAMLATPGPGWLGIGLGAALLAGESRGVARQLDRWELRLHRVVIAARERWRRATLPARGLLVAAAGALAAALVLGAWRLL